jgi:hypothetical protein
MPVDATAFGFGAIITCCGVTKASMPASCIAPVKRLRYSIRSSWNFHRSWTLHVPSCASISAYRVQPMSLQIQDHVLSILIWPKITSTVSYLTGFARDQYPFC